LGFRSNRRTKQPQRVKTSLTTRKNGVPGGTGGGRRRKLHEEKGCSSRRVGGKRNARTREEQGKKTTEKESWEVGNGERNVNHWQAPAMPQQKDRCD